MYLIFESRKHLFLCVNQLYKGSAQQLGKYFVLRGIFHSSTRISPLWNSITAVTGMTAVTGTGCLVRGRSEGKLGEDL